MKETFQHIWNLIIDTFAKSGEDDILTFGAAIAFYTIFSLTPLLILFIFFGGFFLSEATVLQQLKYIVGDFFEDELLQNLSSSIVGRVDGSANIFTTIIAAGITLFGATTVIMQLKASLNQIWKVKEVKMHSIKNFAFNRLLSIGMILTFTLMLVGSLIAEAVLGFIGNFFAELMPTFQVNLFILFTKIGSTIFAVLSFTLIFKILPDVHARWKDIFVGATVTTLLFLLGKFLIGFYFTSTGIETTYRAAGSLVVFIIWIYYNIIIVLLGAVFTQVYTEKYGGKIVPYRFVILENHSLNSKKLDKK